MAIEIRPLTQDIAGEVSGIDLTRQLSAAEVATLEAGMDRFAVLVYHGQNVMDEQQKQFSLNFGKLEQTEGGNVTAVTRLAKSVVPKRLALLRELAPSASEIVMLFNPATPDPDPQLSDIEAAAVALGLKLKSLPAGTERDLAAAMEALDRMPGAALLIGNDAFFLGRRKELGALSARHSVPAAFEHTEFAASGGLLAYGASLVDSYRLVGLNAGRLLKGEPVAELPVVEPRKFELIVNLKTAKALHLIVPASILGSADEVIE